MRVRVEIVGENEVEETIVRCRKVTPEVDSLVQSLSRNEKTCGLPTFFQGEKQYYLNLSEILFFQTEGEKIFGHTADDSYETGQRLYELESFLPGAFVRISRSTIANTSHIFSIQRGLTRVGKVSFRGSYKEVYVSRKYSQSLKLKMEERYLYEQA